MANRFVRARPVQERLPELRERLNSGEIESFEPFGSAMTRALNRARFDPETGEAVWIEEDYCSPPLAMERAEVLDDYFEALTVVEEDIDEAAGWRQIDDLPGLWEQTIEGTA
ncbi:hypothetical protein [Halovenus halobia]|uniref:hypothetical protein n=1 Tax=Halovenus halobia TaxID=3396622 RepID=UPI003F556D1B